MDEIYEVLKSHVKTARGDRLKKPIDDLAGGRVYTGRQALEEIGCSAFARGRNDR